MDMKLVVATVLLSFFMMTQVSAVSIGLSPSQIEFKNVLRNGYAEKSITLTTDSEREIKAHHQILGDIEDWIRLDPAENNFTFSLNNPYKVKVIIEPPDNVMNQVYTGRIRFTTDELAPLGPESTGAIVKTSVLEDINVEITGNQIFSCKVGGAHFKDTEIGYPIEFTVFFYNQGNVMIEPEINVDIWDKDQTILLLSETLQSETILPTVVQEIWKKIEHHNLEIGQYWVDLTIDDCNFNTLLTFDILKKGSISDKGELIEITNKPWINTGETTEINARFRNTGPRLVTAYFKGEISRDNKIVQLIESEPVEVLSGSETVFSSYFTPQKTGIYTIKGRVYYNDKVTFERASIINVNYTFSMKRVMIDLIPFIIYLILIVIIIYIIRKIQKKKKQ